MNGTRRLAAQVAGSAGAQVWLAFLGIFTTPFILRGLGAAAYGIFALVSVVSAHLSNLELGFGHATVRYLARARAAGDRPGEQAILDTSLAVFLAGGIVAGSLLFTAATFLATSFFHVPAGLQPAAVVAFRLGAVILLASFLGSFFSAALQALGRFDWLNGSRAVFGTAASFGAVATVYTSPLWATALLRVGTLPGKRLIVSLMVVLTFARSGRHCRMLISAPPLPHDKPRPARFRRPRSAPVRPPCRARTPMGSAGGRRIRAVA